MRKVLFLIAVALFSAQGMKAQDVEEFGLFDHVSLGVGVGTTGIGIEAAAPLGNHFQLRAGYTFDPGIKYKQNVDYKYHGDKYTTKAEAELNIGDVNLLVDWYPFTNKTFRVTAGAYIGKERFVTAQNLDPLAHDPDEGIYIGDKFIRVGDDKIAHAAIKVNAFKPYLGIGFGRAVAKSRLAFNFDLGVQFWGKPTLVGLDPDTGKWEEAKKSSDLGKEGDEFLDILSKIVVYPVLQFRLTYRIF